jgi:hypothetical protein
MKKTLIWPTVASLFCFLLAIAAASSSHADGKSGAHPLAGTWSLVAADLLKADGTRVHDYGESPRGRLMIDTQGHYSLQIFKSERPRFASGDKTSGTPAEFESAVLGASTHFGSVAIDNATGHLVFQIEGSSFPNWEGTQQKRRFELRGKELSYRVPPRPDGGIPISVWRKIS